MKLQLRIIAHCPRDHWIYNQDEEVVVASKTVEVENIDTVKFRHTKVHDGIFSKTTETYDAVRYGGDVFRLQYDLSTDCWIGERKYQYPSQGAYFVDYADQFRNHLKGKDWAF